MRRAVLFAQSAAGCLQRALDGCIETLVMSSSSSLSDIVGKDAESVPAAERSGKLAAAAFQRALTLTPERSPSQQFIGIGVVIEDPIAFTIHTDTHLLSCSSSAEDWQDSLAAAVAELFEGQGLAKTQDTMVSLKSRPDALTELVEGRANVALLSGGVLRVEDPLATSGRFSVLCGSFNPLHHGHTGLATTAATRAGKQPAYELSVENADKGVLEVDEVRRRLSQFADTDVVVLTRAPLFTLKTQVLPNSVFAVGFDTAVRLLHPKYYGNSHDGMISALSVMLARGCLLLVGARKEGETAMTHADLSIPACLQPLFSEIPVADFLCDISSTELRQSSVTSVFKCAKCQQSKCSVVKKQTRSGDEPMVRTPAHHRSTNHRRHS